MTTLYLTYDGLTDPLGQSQIIPYLIGLAKKGHIITIISFEKNERFKNQQQYIQTILSTSNITWIPLVFKTTPPIISTILNLIKLNSAIKSILKKQDIKLIHCRSYLTTIVALKFKSTKRAILFDIRGFWADERIDGNIWSVNSCLYRTIYKLFKKIELNLFEKSNHVICLTHKGKQIIQSLRYIPNQPLPVTVIPCCVDTDTFNKENLDKTILLQFKAQLDIDSNDIIISYLGSLGTWYMLDEMLLFFKALLQKYNAAKFLLITQDDPAIIYTKASQLGISANQLLITSATRNEVPYLLSLSSASLFFITPTFSKKASSPTKQAEIMSLGIPIICNDGIGDTGQLIETSESGLLLKSLTQVDFEQAVENFEKLLKISPEKIRTIALQNFSLTKGVEQYNQVYNLLENNLS